MRTILAAAPFLFAGAAAAAPIPLPAVSFTADMHILVPGREDIVVKLFHTPRNLRYEIAVRGQRRIILLDRQVKSLTVLDPRRRFFAKRPYTPRADIVAQLPPASARLERVGTEKIGNLDSIKYKADGRTHGGLPFRGHVWMTTDRIVLRVRGLVRRAGRAVRITVELRKVKVGPIDDKRFQVPEDYKPAPAPKPK